MRSYLDYGGVIYYQPNNGLSEKTESIQHNAELAITAATYQRNIKREVVSGIRLLIFQKEKMAETTLLFA